LTGGTEAKPFECNPGQATGLHVHPCLRIQEFCTSTLLRLPSRWRLLRFTCLAKTKSNRCSCRS